MNILPHYKRKYILLMQMNYKAKTRLIRRVFGIVVCLAGLEPTTSTSEVDILSSQTTGTYYTIIQFLFIDCKKFKRKILQIIINDFIAFQTLKLALRVGFYPLHKCNHKILRLSQQPYYYILWFNVDNFLASEALVLSSQTTSAFSF